MFKNVASQKLVVFAFDTTTNLPKTGDAANLTAYVSKDYGAVTVLGDTSATEMDSTNAKGYYLFDLTQAETNADTLLFSAKSSTANIQVIGAPAAVFTYPSTGILAPTVSGRTLDVSAGGEAGVDWANVGSPTTAVNLSATNIDVDQIVASVTGAVGSVTGNVGGNVVGSVGSVAGGVTGGVGSINAGGITSASFAAGAINASAIADNAIDAGAIAADAITAAKIATGAIDADAIADNAIDAGAIAADAITAAKIATGAIDADAIAADAANEIADALLDRSNGIETSYTLRQSLRLILSAVAAKLSGAATTTVAIRDVGDSKDRITATVDANGNRTAVTLDAS